jgi:rod shape-determining protein MreD
VLIQRLRMGLFVVLIVIAQTAVFPHLRIAGVAPSLGVVATVAVAYREGPEAGALFGFVTGLAIDLFLRTPLGLSALSWALTGYVVGVVQGALLRSARWVAIALGGLGGLLGGALFVLVGALVGQEQLITNRTIRVLLIESAYDALIAPLVFFVTDWALRGREARTPSAASRSGWSR